MAAAFSVRKLADRSGLELELEVVLELVADDWDDMELAEELEKLPTELVSCLLAPTILNCPDLPSLAPLAINISVGGVLAFWIFFFKLEWNFSNS